MAGMVPQIDLEKVVEVLDRYGIHDSAQLDTILQRATSLDGLPLHPLPDLPDDILSKIFSFCALDHGRVHLPYLNTPPQVTISHVCSRWRQIALGTRELWAHIKISQPDNFEYEPTYRRWLARAGNHPTNIAINFDYMNYMPMDLIKKLFTSFRIQLLEISLTDIRHLTKLAQVPEVILSDLKEVSLNFTSVGPEVNSDNIISVPSFVKHTRDVGFRWSSVGEEGFMKLIDALDLSWAQLRRIHCGISQFRLAVWLDILRQTTALEECKLSVGSVESDPSIYGQPLTMSRLRTFDLTMHALTPRLNSVIPLFILPNLSKLLVYTYKEYDWTRETNNVMERQYNLKGLQEIEFHGYPFSISTVLKGSPALTMLAIQGDAIMDDDAVIGISTGSLGKHLRSLTIYGDNDIGEMLDMVKVRQANARKSLEGENRSEEIASLTDVKILSHCTKDEGYTERAAALKELGVNVDFSADALRVSP